MYCAIGMESSIFFYNNNYYEKLIGLTCKRFGFSNLTAISNFDTLTNDMAQHVFAKNNRKHTKSMEESMPPWFHAGLRTFLPPVCAQTIFCTSINFRTDYTYLHFLSHLHTDVVKNVLLERFFVIVSCTL